MTEKLTIATRESPLALWQANHVAALLVAQNPKLEVELLGMTTRGDQIQNSPLAKIGGKALFVKELESALLEGKADIAVHSMKDVPMLLPEGLHVPVIMTREDPRDAFVSNHYNDLESLPENAIVGTCSLRRQAQLLAKYPDLQIRSLRGNIQTRLRKLDEGEFDAIILAASGLIRMGYTNRIKQAIPDAMSLPAAGQGALGIECRQGDERIEAIIAPLQDIDSSLCVRAERSMNRALNGGCQAPIAGFAELVEAQLTLRGLVASLDGKIVITSTKTGIAKKPEALGEEVALELMSHGGKAILDSIGLA